MFFTAAEAQDSGRGRSANHGKLDQKKREFGEKRQKMRERGAKWAAKNRFSKTWQEKPNGRAALFLGIDKNRILFYQTDNVDAADTTSTDELQSGGSSGLDLDGTGVLLHIWDGGKTRTTHQEFDGRVTQQDGAIGISTHATHVSGTLVAQGESSDAHGMASKATLHAYDFDNDDSEMASAAAGAVVSNHSYGTVTGWDQGDYGEGSGWYWFGDVTQSEVEDNGFGFYSSQSEGWDQIAFDAPFYLICKSAGNDRNDSHVGQHYHWNGDLGLFGDWELSSDTHPPDGNGGTGYDSMSTKGSAKNVLTVGAVHDIVGGYTQPGDVTTTSFSAWGPCDDGRIKPDIVANGQDLYSCFAGSDSSYGNFSGTSMSTPNASGSLALLVEHYRNTHNGNDMRSATLKGLAIHSADEAGPDPGPDYMFGWGLLNVLNAANKITEDKFAPAIIQELTLAQGQTIEQDIEYSGSGPMKVTICWTDVPGTPPGSSLVDPNTPMLVNDLDLRIIDPNLNEYQPWRLDGLNPTAPATRGDNDIDNIEIVLIDNPPGPGIYTVRISHKGTISNGPQAFSMIAGGGQISVPPQNDECQNAICLEDGSSYQGTTIDATGSSFSDCGFNDPNRDVWFVYTPMVDEPNVIISLCGSDFDTTLSVFDACNAITALACNDNSCGLQSQVQVFMTTGVSYFFRVAGANGTAGNYTITVTGGSGVCSTCAPRPQSPFSPNPVDQAENVSIYEVLKWGDNAAPPDSPESNASQHSTETADYDASLTRVDIATHFDSTREEVAHELIPSSSFVESNQTGGPDAGGYTFIDSSEPGGPVFNWIDISGTGTNLNLGDDQQVFINPGATFSIEFYGTVYSTPSVLVSSNGLIYFGPTSQSDGDNICIPGSFDVDRFVAPYWDDLYPVLGTAKNVYAQANFGPGSDNQLIIQWDSVETFPDPNESISAQVIFFESTGQILMQYLDPGSNPGAIDGISATVGIQENGTTGLQYSCDESNLQANLAILFIPPSVPQCESVYDVYLDTQNPPATLICMDVALDPNDPNLPLTCAPPVLPDACTTYYWRAVGKNGCCPNTSGPVWSFTTGIPADVNTSGNVDLLDFSLLTSPITIGAVCESPAWCDGADINRSGAVGLDDIALLALYWLDNCVTP
jgi:hypothetical protein